MQLFLCKSNAGDILLSSLTCLQPVGSDKADCADIYQLKNVEKEKDRGCRRKEEIEGAEPPGRHTLRDAGGSNQDICSEM